MATGDPAGKDGANRRRFVRVPLTTMVHYRVDSAADLTSDPTVDLSLGGFFLRTEHPRPLGSRIFFKLQLRSGESVLEGVATVVRCVQPAPGVTPGMALEFREMTETSRAHLRELVEKTPPGTG